MSALVGEGLEVMVAVVVEGATDVALGQGLLPEDAWWALVAWAPP